MNKTEILYGPNAQQKINNIKLAGKAFLHILADFDKTLTYARTNGKDTPSIISILYNEGYLSEEYSEKAKNLEKIYRPIESDYSIPLETRKVKMLERRTKHRNLLIDSHLSRKHIQKVIDSGLITFRAGCRDFLEMVNNAGIPVIILSASGLGKDAISLYLNKQISHNNIHVISNGFIRDNNDKAIAYQEPIITSLNKNETIISKEKFPDIYQNIANRKNVILLGDQIEDIEMATGFDYDILLKIGFLNSPTLEKAQKYQEFFDIVFLGDIGMEEIINITKNILN